MHLFDLPLELQFQIASHVRPRDFASWIFSCKRLKWLCDPMIPDHKRRIQQFSFCAIHEPVAFLKEAITDPKGLPYVRHLVFYGDTYEPDFGKWLKEDQRRVDILRENLCDSTLHISEPILYDILSAAETHRHVENVCALIILLCPNLMSVMDGYNSTSETWGPIFENGKLTTLNCLRELRSLSLQEPCADDIDAALSLPSLKHLSLRELNLSSRDVETYHTWAISDRRSSTEAVEGSDVSIDFLGSLLGQLGSLHTLVWSWNVPMPDEDNWRPADIVAKLAQQSLPIQRLSLTIDRRYCEPQPTAGIRTFEALRSLDELDVSIELISETDANGNPTRLVELLPPSIRIVRVSHPGRGFEWWEFLFQDLTRNVLTKFPRLQKIEFHYLGYPKHKTVPGDIKLTVAELHEIGVEMVVNTEIRFQSAIARDLRQMSNHAESSRPATVHYH